jgi:hypothetical protein
MTVRVYQSNIEVLGGVTVTPGVRAYQSVIEVLGTPEVPLVHSTLTSNHGQYSISGQSAELTIASRVLVGGVSVNTISGQNANLIAARSLVGGQAQYLVVGQDAGLVSSASSSSPEPVSNNSKNRMMLGVG